MTATTHVDYSEVVKKHFAQTNQLPLEVSEMNPGLIQELIDAVPEENRELIEALRKVLRG